MEITEEKLPRSVVQTQAYVIILFPIVSLSVQG